MAFTRAVKTSAKLRLALAGPAGSGKTFTALKLATELADGKPIAVIDTERGSAAKYADLYAFDVLELDSFHPQRYIEAVQDAVAGGYAVVVIDSLSHAWNGKGGILEIVQRKNNGIKAWAEVKPIENALLDTLTGAQIHIIATMRTKTEYVVEQDERGKSAPRKVGTAPIQRDGMEYEFDVFGELDQENTLTIHKTRCPALTGAVIAKPGKPMADTLRTWLTAGPPPAPAASASASIPAADEKRKVVTPQTARDRARIDAEPITDETPITYSALPVEEPAEVDAELDEEKAKPTALQLKRIEKACGLLGRQVPQIDNFKHAKLILASLEREYREMKAQEQARLDRPSRKAAQA